MLILKLLFCLNVLFFILNIGCLFFSYSLLNIAVIPMTVLGAYTTFKKYSELEQKK